MWVCQKDNVALHAGTFLDGERLGKKARRQLHLNDNVISFGMSPFRFKLIGEHSGKL